jgi:ketosteroid isomerase-like protein
MFRTSHEAEAAFYAAFEAGDVDAMMSVWADDNAIVCIHPMGPRLEGQAGVRDSWTQILAGGNDGVAFEISHTIRSESDGLATHLVIENITFGAAMTERSIVYATNVYRDAGDGWRMICHHGSPGRVGTVQLVEPTGAIH